MGIPADSVRSRSAVTIVAASVITLVAGCGLPLTQAQQREQNRRKVAREVARQQLAMQRAGAASGCSHVELLLAAPAKRWYVTAGCGVLSRLQLTCDGETCSAGLENATRLDRPSRLQETGPGRWRDPALAAAAPENRGQSPNENSKPPTIVTGKVISDVTRGPLKPTLPADLRHLGFSARKLYKVCVSTQGTVSEVDVLGSTTGLERHWLAKIENWKYRPYAIDGKPFPFCYTLTLTVTATN
jgi:hypothetical protein